MKIIPLPSQARLKELFDYDQNTGSFTVLSGMGRPIKAVPQTYRRSRVDDVVYKTHRLIWMWMTGIDPGSLEVDHINRDKLDNSWSNLRLGTSKQNNENTGAKGFYWNKRLSKWQAYITHNRKQYYLGLFDCALMAHLAYMDKKKELHSWGY